MSDLTGGLHSVDGIPDLTMHRGQYAVMRSRARNRVVVAGRRWGKTQTAKIAIIEASSVAKRLIWYVAPTYQMAKDIMWYELLDAIPRGWIRKINETRLTIILKNKSVIQLKGADKPDTLRGRGVHFLVLDEFQDMREDTWKKVLRPTLASTGGRALIIGTPKSFNQLYEVYMRGQDPRAVAQKQWESWQFPTITSPFIPPEEIEAAKADLDEKSFKQEFEASFETMSGRVYYPFDRKIHIGDYGFNPKLPIWIGQDFNIDPMSSVVMQPQPNGEVWIVDEIIQFNSNTEETAQELDRRFWRNKKQIILFPDPAGANRAHTRGESDLDILRQAGFKRLRYRRKHPKIADRVNAVNRMLKAANGEVRLRVNRKCKHTIDAFEQTIYKTGSREVDKTQSVEHPADALGYCIDIMFPARQLILTGVSR